MKTLSAERIKLIDGSSKDHESNLSWNPSAGAYFRTH
jgi:hypothetical protein